MPIPRVMSNARSVVVVALAVLLVFVAVPAEAAKPPVRTTIAAHLAPATALVQSTAVVSGTVTPKGGTLVLQRLIGKTWVTVAHQKSTAAGTFAFNVRTPKAAATWALRVTRASTKSTKAGVSNAVKLHVVGTAFNVAAVPLVATLTVPAAIAVTGAVAPRTRGTVQLQRLTGSTWVNVASAALSSTSTFTVTSVQPVGAQRLRVVKPFSATVAGGTSGSFDVTVQPAAAVAPAPTITTAALPAARVGRLYSTALTATGGTGAYTWSASGLPTGLALSAVGTLTGTPSAKGLSRFTVTVTDAAGHSASVTLSLTTAPPQGYLVAWGNNINGQLGNGTATNATTPVPVTGLSAVVSVVGGASAGYALAADGTVWAWGYNIGGQLGNGTSVNSKTPVEVTGLTGIVAIAAGSNSALAVRSDGTVWAWGTNGFGQLGDGTTTTRPTPVQVQGLTSVVAVSSGFESSYALRSDGTVWSWGHNDLGELGHGDLLNTSTPSQVVGLTGVTAIAAGREFCLALKADGTVWSWGSDVHLQLDNSPFEELSPVQALGLTGVKAIGTADSSGYAITANGTLMAWGDGANGELGNGANPTASGVVPVDALASVTGIAGSQLGAIALLSDGTVRSWGGNGEGELGNATTTGSNEPVSVVGLSQVLQVGSGSTATSGYAIVGT